MWLEAKTGDVQSSCLATATVAALATAVATPVAAGTVGVAAAAAAAAVTTPTTDATCSTMAEPTNLRHSASFSCLYRNNTAMASTAAVVPLSSKYRARMATLSAVDLDYGFVMRPGAIVAATVVAAMRSGSTMVAQGSPSCDLSTSYSCCVSDGGGKSGVGSASGNLLSSSETGLSSISAVACIRQADDDWIKSEHERRTLSKKVLIKKSVSLLNPNGWWAPKFRGGGKSNKNKDKNLQEIQTQKRWKSLGALLRVSKTNSSRTSTVAQSSLRAPQSFYLLDDFLEPSTNRLRGDEETGRHDSCSNSTSVRLSFSTKAQSAPRSVLTQHLDLEHKNSAYTDFCSVCKQYGDGGNRDRDTSITSFDSAVLQRYCCRNYIAADSPRHGVFAFSSDGGVSGCSKSTSPGSRTEKRHSEFPLLQSGDTSCIVRSQNLRSKDHVCSSGQQVSLESSGLESLNTRSQPSQLRTTRASSSVVRHNSLYSSSLLNKTEGSQTNDENVLSHGSDANVKVAFSATEAPRVAKPKRSLSKSCFTVSNSYCEKTNKVVGGAAVSCSSDNSGNNNNNVDTKILPLTPAEALERFGAFLTEYEKKEVMNFGDVWFLGLNACKLKSDENSGINFGYDDENGNYNKVLNDHLYYRYEVLDVLGKGSFGQVVKAFDHKTKTYVAIKIIRNKKRFYHQAQVELVILNHLRKKDTNRSHNVIHMLDYFYFRRHLCITFELLHVNLYEVIKRNGYHGFNLSIVRKYAFSLVQCLMLLYRENIIHCDLKPENILLQRQHSHEIKVIDFGSSCYTHQKVYTYIQSRFYRSPEIILGLPYDRAIDMWSFGCILAELHTGYPLFPGENEVEQLACIMEIIGLPPYDVLARATRRKLFFDTKGSPRCTVNSKQRKRKPGSRDLSEALRTDDVLFIDFIARCLEWNPEKRLAADEALQHSWLKNFASDEAIASDLRIEESCNFLPPL